VRHGGGRRPAPGIAVAGEHDVRGQGLDRAQRGEAPRPADVARLRHELRPAVAGGRVRRAQRAADDIFTLGFAAFEAPRLADPRAEERVVRSREIFGGVGDAQMPHLRRVGPLLGRHPSEASFPAGLGWLLDGLAGARR
jgi:hypothetical protein